MKTIRLLFSAAFFFFVGNAGSVTVTPTFEGAPGTNNIGSGNWTNICLAACKTWELAIRDPFNITIHFTWGAEGGYHMMNRLGGSPLREVEGTIVFNNDNDPGHFSHYFSPDPLGNSDKTNFLERVASNLGCTNPVNSTRCYRYSSSGSQIDFYTHVMHELGHALGLYLANTNFTADAADGYLDIVYDPYVGMRIGAQTNIFGLNAHIVNPSLWYDRMVMSGGGGAGECVLPSAVDILAVAKAGQFTDLNYDLKPQLEISPEYKVIKNGKWVVQRDFTWFQLLPLPPGKQCVLKSCSDLSQGTWTTVASGVIPANGIYKVTITSTAPSEFFCLMTE